MFIIKWSGSLNWSKRNKKKMKAIAKFELQTNAFPLSFTSDHLKLEHFWNGKMLHTLVFTHTRARPFIFAWFHVDIDIWNRKKEPTPTKQINHKEQERSNCYFCLLHPNDRLLCMFICSFRTNFLWVNSFIFFHCHWCGFLFSLGIWHISSEPEFYRRWTGLVNA